ncbi:MAG: lysophospholipid acyltransferase family protein [Deltaproteobacteria bacterium]|nr:lysophospholipid acyltransferase family protein [Deltaproteobacteria bacterium]
MSAAPPPTPDELPRVQTAPSGVGHWFAALILKLSGWTVDGAPPDLDRYVVLAVPHTAWWDGVWMLLFARWWNVRLAWMGKHTLMRWPISLLLRRLGIVPVDRRAPQGLVGQIVEQFEQRDRLVLAIPPEGTRRRRDFWKSGFYHIAVEAKVPVCMSFLDYGRRTAGFGPCFWLTGDMRRDMDRIREFYADKKGKVPADFTPPLLREELEAVPSTGEPQLEHDAGPPSPS